MNQSSKFIIGIIVAIVIIWTGYALLSEPATAPGEEEENEVPAATASIKIGLSAPTTGEAANLGEQLSTGALFAVKEINDAGGIKGRKVELVIEDDTCTPKSVNAITKLVDVDKVVGIVGPVCSSAAEPAIPIAEKGKVPVLVIGSAPHLAKLGDYIFRHYPSDAYQGKFAAEVAWSKLSKKNAAVIYTKNPWGQGIRDVFVPTFESLGGKVVFDEGVTQDTTDLRTVIAKAKTASPDIIYVPLYPKNAIAAFKQLKELGVKAVVLGGDALEDKSVLDTKESEGVLYTVSTSAVSDEFMAKIKTAMNKDAGVFTLFAYDGVKILAAAIEKAGTDTTAIKEALKTLVYEGGASNSRIEFDADGDLKVPDPSKAFALKVIKNGTAGPYTTK